MELIDSKVKTTRRRDAQSTIAELKAAVTRQLVSEGLANLSIQPIIDTAGVSRGALFHHFPTKNHLIAAAFTDLLEVATERLQEHALRLRRQELSIREFVSRVRSVFCSEMFVGSMEVGIAIRVDQELAQLLKGALENWSAALAAFWHGTFDLPGVPDEDARQHWIMASHLLRGHAFSTSQSGSPSTDEPFCVAFEGLALRGAVVRKLA